MLNSYFDIEDFHYLCSMEKSVLVFIIMLFVSSTKAQQTAPSGLEWENPQSLSYGKNATTSNFWPFGDELDAHGVLPGNSKYVISLNGPWAFNWANTPDSRPQSFYISDYDVSLWDTISVPGNWNVQGLQKNGVAVYGKPIYVNQKVIFQHAVKPDDWRGGVMRTPPQEWTTYIDRNEVGSYRRIFTIPKFWNGRKIFLRFDGVDSFFYLWVNGHYCGFSKNSRSASVFDITPYITNGENSVSVEVYRNSDGSFLEAQDMFRLPGIFRDVWLYSTPTNYIADLQVRSSLCRKYSEGNLEIKTKLVTGIKNKNLKLCYRLYELPLYTDSVTSSPILEKRVGIGTLKARETYIDSLTLQLAHPRLWSAEMPNRYLLTATLENKKNEIIESTAIYIGFRSVELKDVSAEDDEFGIGGRQMLINGHPVKLRGVNRHETDPNVGHAIRPERMEKDVLLMKRANINHVRNSHYPAAPYWYYLCDKYGIYLMDEANIESHEYYYGTSSLSHVAEFRDAHIGRVMDMAIANANHPSVILWSLGNEAGPGLNFKAAYDSLSQYDKRPINYERNNDYADFGSCQYPSISWVNDAVKGGMEGIKYPFHINEYAHSMGNSMGNLVDYWKAIESNNNFMGAAIWDWVDQGLYFYKDNKRFVAYGGDFGDVPNDGQFVMNGIMLADLTPKPQYFEIKKVYQPIEVKMIDSSLNLEIFNKNYFTTLIDYDCVLTLMEDGLPLDTVVLAGIKEIEPRTRKGFENPWRNYSFNKEKEYFINVDFITSTDKPWAEKGYIQYAEQIPMAAAVKKNIPVNSGIKLKIVGNRIIGDNFVIDFDKKTGSIRDWRFNGCTIIPQGHGPRIDAFRALTSNDNWMYKKVYSAGLHNLDYKAYDWKYKLQENGNAQVICKVIAKAPNKAEFVNAYSNHPSVNEMSDSICDFALTISMIYDITPKGTITINSKIESNDSSQILPRVGFAMELPKNFENIEYYGRGPEENYPDRKTGARVGRYQSTVDQQFVAYSKPQNMANHEDVRWLFVKGKDCGIRINSESSYSFTVLGYSEKELVAAPHPENLKQSQYNYLHLDKAVTGLGGNSCGQGAPLKADRVYATPMNFSLTFTPEIIK